MNQNDAKNILPDYFYTIFLHITQNKPLSQRISIKNRPDIKRKYARIRIGSRFYSVQVERPIIEQITTKISKRDIKGASYLVAERAKHFVKNVHPLTLSFWKRREQNVIKTGKILRDVGYTVASFGKSAIEAELREARILNSTQLTEIEREAQRQKQSTDPLTHDLGSTNEFFVGVGDEISVLGPDNVATMNLKKSLNTHIAVEKYLCMFKHPVDEGKNTKEIDQL